jgi:hypothetical protein
MNKVNVNHLPSPLFEWTILPNYHMSFHIWKLGLCVVKIINGKNELIL